MYEEYGRIEHVQIPKNIEQIKKITFILPVPKRRFANDAALCDSYSRKQKPLFFFLSSGEL